MKRFNKVEVDKLVAVIITDRYNTLGINTDIQQLYVDCTSVVRDFFSVGYSKNTAKSVENYIELVLPITIKTTIFVYDNEKDTDITRELHSFYNRLLDFVLPALSKSYTSIK